VFATLSDSNKAVAFAVLVMAMALAAALAIRSVGVASGLIMMLVATSHHPSRLRAEARLRRCRLKTSLFAEWRATAIAE
jgi:hypothetical protein